MANIERIAEHSIDRSLINKDSYILDLGCRGFLFQQELQHWVNFYSIDADHLDANISYYRLAISNFNGTVGIKRNPDPQAVSICLGDEVPCMTLKSFSMMVGVKFWDVIKMDIEGSEYEVIMSLSEPPAVQLSVEFHLHCAYGGDKMKEMEDKLNKWYEPLKHEMTNEHCAGMNYWDSLWVLK